MRRYESAQGGIPMNFEKWEETRFKGKARFLWVIGFLGWGITTAVVWSVVMHYIQPQEAMWVRPIIALVIFPPVGLIWAHFVWKKSEKKYVQQSGSS